jgi:hypothetical protein
MVRRRSSSAWCPTPAPRYIYIYVFPEPSDENSPFRAGFPPCTCPSCTGASWHPTSSGLSVARHYDDFSLWWRGTAHMPGRCVRERQAACGAAICRPRKLLIRKIVFFPVRPSLTRVVRKERQDLVGLSRVSWCVGGAAARGAQCGLGGQQVCANQQAAPAMCGTTRRGG